MNDMTNYKQMPVEPTPEMLQAACDEEQRPLPMWSRMKAIYTAMLAAAPVINIIATRNEQGQIVCVTLQDEDHRMLEVIAEANVQREPVGWVWHSYNQTNFTSGSHHKEVLEADGVKLTPVYTAPQPAEQPECGGNGAGGEHEEDCSMVQPPPDVDVLLEALQAISGNELDAQRSQYIAAVALDAYHYPSHESEQSQQSKAERNILEGKS